MGRLDVRGVDDSVLAEFKSCVREKYGKLHTVMGLEVERALRYYLNELTFREGTRTQKEEVETPEKKKDARGLSQAKLMAGYKVPGDVMFGSVRTTRGHKVIMEIIAQLQEIGQWNGHDLNRKVVERLAWKYGGMDPRTVKNYADKVMSVWLYKENWEPTLIAQAERILTERHGAEKAKEEIKKWEYGGMSHGAVSNGKSEFI